MVHASNLLVLPSGETLAAAFSGSVEGASGVAIALYRLPGGGRRWEGPAVVIFQQQGFTAQNPVLAYDAGSGVLTLLHTLQVANQGQGTSEIRRQTSSDGGRSWSASSQRLPLAAGTFIRGQVVLGRNGDWILPAYATPAGYSDATSQYSFMLRSPDRRGATWSVGADGTRGKVVQPSVVRVGGGRLLAFFRSRAGDSVYVSRSDDDAFSWSSPERTPLPNPNSGVSAAVLLPSGWVALAFNNAQGTSGPRWPLTVAVTADEGRTFTWAKDIFPADPGVGPL